MDVNRLAQDLTFNFIKSFDYFLCFLFSCVGRITHLIFFVCLIFVGVFVIPICRVFVENSRH